MRIRDLYENIGLNIPDSVRYTMPRTVLLPDMDLYYEYYQFVKAMACHPELDPGSLEDRDMRDVPIAVAYTPQEYEMIAAVAKRMGKKIQDIAFDDSKEPPGGNTTSPVMKFNMFESQTESMRSLIDEIATATDPEADAADFVQHYMKFMLDDSQPSLIMEALISLLKIAKKHPLVLNKHKKTLLKTLVSYTKYILDDDANYEDIFARSLYLLNNATKWPELTTIAKKMHPHLKYPSDRGVLGSMLKSSEQRTSMESIK